MLAASVAGAVALGVSACGSAEGGDSTPAANSSSADEEQTSEPAPKDTPSASEDSGNGEDSAAQKESSGRCTADHLKPAMGRVGHAAGNVYYDLKLTNTGSSSCGLEGFPGVSLIQRDGSTIGKAATREGITKGAVTLEAGKTGHVVLHTVNKGLKSSGCWDKPDLLKINPPGSKASLTLRTDKPEVCGDTFQVGPVSNTAG